MNDDKVFIVVSPKEDLIDKFKENIPLICSLSDPVDESLVKKPLYDYNFLNKISREIVQHHSSRAVWNIVRSIPIPSVFDNIPEFVRSDYYDRKALMIYPKSFFLTTSDHYKKIIERITEFGNLEGVILTV